MHFHGLHDIGCVGKFLPVLFEEKLISFGEVDHIASPLLLIRMAKHKQANIPGLSETGRLDRYFPG